jgi:heme oxygenase
MLQPSASQRYQEFKQALEQLSKSATAPDLQVAAVREKFQVVQQLFQSQIICLTADDMEEDHTSRWQSFQTEIYKQMRLLETDMMLLQASRSSATSISRASNVCLRINTLIQYCQALLQL